MIKFIIFVMLNIYANNYKYSYCPKSNVTHPKSVSVKPFDVGHSYFMQSDLFEEIFKPIKGYENYIVSNLGNVYNTNRRGKKFQMKSKNNGFDMLVGLSKDGVRIRVNVSKLVAEQFIKNPNNYQYVKKIDGNIENNNVNNLFWTDNSADNIVSSIGKLQCNICTKFKPPFYFKDKKLKKGHTYRKTCSECMYKIKKEKYGHKIQDYRDTQHFKQSTTIDGRASLLLYRCKRRSRLDNIELNITKDDILDLLNSKKCQVTNIPLVFNGDKRNPYSPSIDRIDSNKGYIKGNVQVTCFIYNMCKNTFTDEDVIAFVTKFYNNKIKTSI